MAFDNDLAGPSHSPLQGAAALHAPEQYGLPAIDEALGQRAMQRVGELVLDGARQLLPMGGIGQPARAMGNVGPGADMGDAGHQGIDVALGMIQARDLRCHPVGRQAPRMRGQIAENLGQQLGVGIAHHLAEIGHLADLPEQAHGGRPTHAAHDLRVAFQGGQGQLIVRLARADEGTVGRAAFQALSQRGDGMKVERAAAPAQGGNGIEAMIFDGIDRFRRQLADLRRGAEAAVVHMPAGTAGDLGEFGGQKLAGPAPIEFAEAGKGDMGQIHIEPHADGIRRHEIIHLARLVHFDLGIARARAERAHHHRAAAALAAHHLGDTIDLSGRKPHHRAARRQARGLARAAVAECREPRAGDEVEPGQQAAQHGPHGIGPQQHGLIQAAGMQNAIGEDMAPLGIGGHLNLVDGKKADRPLERHGFDRADEVLRGRRDDLFLARHQGDGPIAFLPADPIVVLTGEQAKGKSDHAPRMAHHALDGQVGLTGVCRTEHGGQAGAGSTDHQSNIVERPGDCKAAAAMSLHS